ncbi:hypothetical protein TCAL_09816 [Tigriopus californicus]|uniref:GTPase Era, mitochondrial n=1 Tax=Tigriopus californicus TaxID=6832 RepID=A0A553NQM9_TIGCA|nr:GTPase Era, mitochondrial-like [Tigriopus californicus]TRY67736.1 hypothetical protein TCAL_09816 [Tigriopus californicus]
MNALSIWARIGRPHRLWTRPSSGLAPQRHLSFQTCRCRRKKTPFIESAEAQIFRQIVPDVIHLNPASHARALTDKPAYPTRPGFRPQSLEVSVLGVPNAGKSTLVNTLVGVTACPHSSKVHTTRQNSDIIYTQDETQIIFRDTPGVVRLKDAAKFHLENTLVNDPEQGCSEADVIVVVQDVSNRYVREALDKRILRLLCLFHHIPSVLVLNKIDTIPKSRRVYDLIRKLTCNRLRNQVTSTRILPQPDPRSVESYLKSKEKAKPVEKKVRNEDFLATLQATEILTETKVAELTEGVVGWPNFTEVFTISALSGEGISPLRDFLLHSARDREWRFSDKLVTRDNPKDIVIRTLKAKLLDVLPEEIPYALQPEIEFWNCDEGTLKVGILIKSKVERYVGVLLSNGGDYIKTFAKLAEQDLQNFFQTEVFVSVNVKLTGKRTDKVKRRTVRHAPAPFDVLV